MQLYIYIYIYIFVYYFLKIYTIQPSEKCSTKGIFQLLLVDTLENKICRTEISLVSIPTTSAHHPFSLVTSAHLLWIAYHQEDVQRLPTTFSCRVHAHHKSQPYETKLYIPPSRRSSIYSFPLRNINSTKYRHDR